jgi:hypothetical protein
MKIRHRDETVAAFDTDTLDSSGRMEMVKKELRARVYFDILCGEDFTLPG